VGYPEREMQKHRSTDPAAPRRQQKNTDEGLHGRFAPYPDTDVEENDINDLYRLFTTECQRLLKQKIIITWPTHTPANLNAISIESQFPVVDMVSSECIGTHGATP
jgi:hypothetical protein